MASARLIVQRYAQALHSLASEGGALEAVDSQLSALHELLAETPELAEQLANPRLTREVKTRVLTQLLPAGEGSDLVRKVALLLTRNGRAALLSVLKEVYDEIAMAAAGRQVARVKSSHALDDATRQRIQASLAALTGNSITLEEAVDASLLGGVTVQIGSKLIDGSLRGRLEKIQDKLLRAPIASVSADA